VDRPSPKQTHTDWKEPLSYSEMYSHTILYIYWRDMRVLINYIWIRRYLLWRN